MTTQQTERELQRYGYGGADNCCDCGNAHSLVAQQDGEYVRYDDIAPLLSTIAQQGEALEAAYVDHKQTLREWKRSIARNTDNYADAERYRYLRDHCSTADIGGLNMIATETVFTTLVPTDWAGEFPSCIDVGIDAALISQKVEG